jgi:UDP-N-acetylglucosamine acyltransferase
MATQIHPTAVVDPKATLGDGVVIGPLVTIDAHVTIGPGTEVKTGSTITGHTTIGARNIIGPRAVLGTPPQDIGYAGEDTRLVVGDDNTLREFVTMNTASTKHDWVTEVGSRNFIMAYCHVGHDCKVGSDIVMANSVGFSGHCRIDDKVWFGGMVGLHQFCTVGTHAFIGGLSRIVHDCPPYMVTEGNPAKVRGVNTIGLRRRGFTNEAIDALKKAQRLIWRSHLTASQAVAQYEADSTVTTPEVAQLIDFLRATHAGRQGRGREALRTK